MNETTASTARARGRRRAPGGGRPLASMLLVCALSGVQAACIPLHALTNLGARGRVLDAATGEPVEGARVTMGQDDPSQVLSDAGGTFDIPARRAWEVFILIPGPHHPPPDRRWPRLFVQHPSYATREIDLRWHASDPDDGEVTIVGPVELDHGDRALDGLVVGADGAPVAGATVRIVLQDASERDVTTGADGSWAIERLSGEVAGLLAWSRDELLFEPVVCELAASGPTAVTLVLSEGAVIEGVVRDTDGLPMDGVHAYFWESGARTPPPDGLESMAERMRWRTAFLGTPRSAETDANGRFVLGPMDPSATYDVYCSGVRAAQALSPGGMPLSVVLEAAPRPHQAPALWPPPGLSTGR